MTTSAPPTMTPERWRTVDQILQQALVHTRDHRDEFVAQSCGNDSVLRNEVASLLAAHDATPPEFLERPAIEEHGLDSSATPTAPPVPTATPAQPRRMVSARLTVYAAAAGIVMGTVTGWSLAHSATVERWGATLRAIRQQANVKGTPGANSASGAEATAATGELSLVVVDRGGRTVREIGANRPWTPRFSPDGRRIAYGAVGEGRGTSDVWIADLDGGTTRRLTNDDADNSNPQWSPDGGTIAYSVSGRDGKHIVQQWATGGGARVVASAPGTQFPTDWLHDGSALLVSNDAGDNRFDILVQPSDGSAARPYATTRAQETAGRISPHTHWVAYTSNESGRDEVYVDSYPRPGYRAMVSAGGGADPVWRGDGRELYYWRGDALIAVPIDGSRGGRPPVLGAERVLFHSAYEHSLNSMYDVSPDGSRIALVRRR
jgi:eukaryotic-like serine/threonine-protein kinase